MRKAGKGKSEFITRPLQKLVPLEISSSRDNDKEVRNAEIIEEKGEMRMENGSQEVTEEKIGTESENGRRSQLLRAAARDARWKTQLMLDP